MAVPDQRLSYEPPGLQRLGTLVDLTQFSEGKYADYMDLKKETEAEKKMS